jgi:hypothetical protein
MVDYMAKVHVLSRLCDLGEEVERDAWGKGTCKVQMARGGMNSLFKNIQASLNNHVSIKDG